MDALFLALLPLTYFAALALERVFPARPLPPVKGWVLKGFVFFVVSVALNTLVPAFVADAVASRIAPVNLEWLGLLGILPVVIATEAIGYWVHRVLHRVHFLWRWTHQLHHSAERFDISGAAYFHPFDVVVQAGVPTLLVALLGVTPMAAALAGYVGFLAAMFQHLNVKTPRWVAYFVLRPEQHSVHHARGVHAYNYGNFAFMDLIFGTFRNPESFAAEQGFWDGASAKVGAMLLGRDVGAPETASAPIAAVQESLLAR